MQIAQQTLENSSPVPRPEFDLPPADPLALLRQWWAGAVEAGVREPGAVALATVGADGRPSSRIIQTLRITDEGLIFTSHAGSQKGREIAANGFASGVFYWRETAQQIVLAGTAGCLPEADSDALWAARPPATHPMSVAARQSEPLADEEELRQRARALAESGEPLARPASWVGYLLAPSMLEFWQGSPDRLHRRLRYDRDGDSWKSVRLQP